MTTYTPDQQALARRTLRRLIQMRSTEVTHLWFDLAVKAGRKDLMGYLDIIADWMSDLGKALDEKAERAGGDTDEMPPVVVDDEDSEEQGR